MRSRDETRMLRWRYVCPVEAATNLGCYRTRRLGPTGSFNLNFFTPSDFMRLISARLLGFPLDSFAGKIICVTVEHALLGEPRNARSNTHDYACSGTAGLLVGFDIFELLAGLRPDSIGGLTIDHQTIGTSVDYLGLEITYSAVGD